MTNQIECKHFNELTTVELYSILELRCAVFMIEQNCNESELDGRDLNCYHLLITSDSRLIAYARLLPPGLTYPQASIGRVVVAPQSRGAGLGFTLMQYAIQYSETLFGKGDIKISAQLYLENFYKTLGFTTISDVYEEAGIKHIKMLKQAAL